MSFSQHWDDDKLLGHLLPILQKALLDWQRGMNSNEDALMNQVTSALNTRRARRCDIGFKEALLVETQLIHLHRQGPKQSDLYGSDLALTVTSPIDPTFIKTTFFQFKIAANNDVSINAKQMADAGVYSGVFDRSFCFAVNPEDRTLRIKSLGELRPGLKKGTASQSFATKRWLYFTEWILGWLRCEIGPWSTRADLKGVEKLLERYRLQSPDAFADQWELEPDYYLAKSWLSIAIKPY